MAQEKPAALSRLAGLFGVKSAPVAWHPAQALYPRLNAAEKFAGALQGKAGIYALWHRGVRPQWLHIGATANLGAAILAMAGAEALTIHTGNDGPFVAWAFPDAPAWSGIVLFLQERLRPAHRAAAAWDVACDPTAAPITFPLPPGTAER